MSDWITFLLHSESSHCWWTCFSFGVIIFYIAIWNGVNWNSLLWITNREFFNELDMISVSFYVTVCHLLIYLRHCMVVVGMFYFSLRSISFWEWKKKTRNCIDFSLALWLVQKTHVTKQSEAKLKLIMTWSPWFSRALGTLGVLP